MVVVKPFKVYPQHSRKLVELDPVPLRPENTVVGCVIHAVCGRVCKPFCLNSTAVGWVIHAVCGRVRKQTDT